MTRWIPDPTDMAPLVERSDYPTIKNLTEKSSEFAPVVDWPATVTKLAKKWENLSETFEPANTASDTMSKFLAMRLVERAVNTTKIPWSQTLGQSAGPGFNPSTAPHGKRSLTITILFLINQVAHKPLNG
ncbi:hypothetical protein C8J57DRAFT_1509908 [Mycena rebaudengoi]|nr:hypothetical protein C8J57DRAFT_1509908 [Mycena rebaudengoi]